MVAKFRQHFQAQLDQIAKNPNNQNSRSVMNGYRDSANYVISKLQQETGCTISTQDFTVPIYTELSPPILQMISPTTINYQRNVDFSGLRYGGNQTIDITTATFNAAFGCSTQDFNGMIPGSIAMIQLGSTSSDMCSTDYIGKAM